MSSPRVAILGASGIGAFHVRELARAGAEVSAILGSSLESAQKTAKRLEEEYHVSPKAYFDLATLLQSEQLDAVAIATPPEMHYEQAKSCLNVGLHVLSEKPFILESHSANCPLSKELVDLARTKGRIVTVNTQWPSALRFLGPFVDTSHVASFSMYSQPGSKGVGLFWDHLPHAGSMLVRLMPGGSVENIAIQTHGDEEADIHFSYSNATSKAEVHFKFTFKAERPRDVGFAINGVEFKRIVGENYKQTLATNGSEIEIEDPFKASISLFVDAVRGKGEPLISPQEILENVALQDKIIAKYEIKN